MGFTLRELSIQTTNSDWQVSFFDRLTKENRNKPLHKMLSIKSLGIYVDTNDQDYHVNQEEGEPLDGFLKRLDYQLVEMFPRDSDKCKDSSYFIEPSKISKNLIRHSQLAGSLNSDN